MKKVYFIYPTSSIIASKVVNSLKNEKNYEINEIILEISIYKKNILRFLRKISLDKLGNFFLKNMIDFSNFPNLEEEDYIIIFDSISEEVATYLITNNKGKWIYWYWNPIKEEKILYLKKRINSIFTFDKYDSLKYGLKYFSQFYWEKTMENFERNEYDTIFIGYTKGREKILQNLKDEFLKNDLNIFFYLLNSGKMNYLKYKIKEKLKKNQYIIPYEKVVDLTKKSKSIIDIVSVGQTGLTLRALEAMFFKKKLITNNLEIKKYEFYNKKNVYILSEDSDIKAFLNSEMDYEYLKNIDKYYVSSWIKYLIENS